MLAGIAGGVLLLPGLLASTASPAAVAPPKRLVVPIRWGELLICRRLLLYLLSNRWLILRCELLLVLSPLLSLVLVIAIPAAPTLALAIVGLRAVALCRGEELSGCDTCLNASCAESSALLQRCWFEAFSFDEKLRSHVCDLSRKEALL